MGDLSITCPERTYKNISVICQLYAPNFNISPNIFVDFGDGDTRHLFVNNVTTFIPKTYSLSSIFNVTAEMAGVQFQYVSKINGKLVKN